MTQKTKNNLNYEKTMNNYRFKFEGLEDPVFYYDLYTTQLNSDKTNMRFDFGQGLKYKANENSVHDAITKKYNSNYQRYQNTFRDFLLTFLADNPNLKIGIVVIPSSQKDTMTVVEAVVNSHPMSPNLLNLTSNLVRVKTKEAAHKGGKRSISENIDTLKFLDDDILHKLDAVLVVDDIITTGNSFRAIKKLFTKLKFSGSIVNFAILHSMNQTAHENYDEWNLNKKSEWNNGNCKKKKKVDAIIFDFDQTLVDTSIRNDQFEEEASNIDVSKIFKDATERRKFNILLNNYSNVYSTYDLEALRKHQEKHIPFAILSNTIKKNVFLLAQTDEIGEALYPDYWKGHQGIEDYNEEICSKYLNIIKRHDGGFFRYYFDFQKNIFYAPGEEDKPYEDRKYYPKPNEKGVVKASDWLKTNFELDNDARIVGVGNTPEDIIAYHKAGIESVLALWGVPEFAKNYAKQNWGADYYFDTLTDFLKWIEEEPPINFDYLEEIKNKIDFKEANENYVIYEEKQDYLWKLKKSKRNISYFYKEQNNHSNINLLAEVKGEQKANLCFVEQLIKTENIDRYENLNFNIYSIIEYFKEKKQWELLNIWSQRLNKSVQVSNRLYEAYCKDELEAFAPGEGKTRERNIIACNTLKSWKAHNLPWPGIEPINYADYTFKTL